MDPRGLVSFVGWALLPVLVAAFARTRALLFVSRTLASAATTQSTLRVYLECGQKASLSCLRFGSQMAGDRLSPMPEIALELIADGAGSVPCLFENLMSFRWVSEEMSQCELS